MRRRLIALMLAGAMLVLSGCSANVAMDKNGKVTIDGVPIEDVAGELGINLSEEDGSTELKKDPALGGSPWIDSDLKSNIKEDMDLSPGDDFHLYVNHEWLLKSEIRTGKTSENTFTGIQDKVNEKALALLEDDTLDSHDARLVQSLYKAILDWDARDKAGLDPVMDTVRDIEGIESLKDMSDLICDPDRSMFVPTLTDYGNMVSYDDSDSYICAVAKDSLMLGDAAEYGKRTELGENACKSNLYLAKAMLTRLDYTESKIDKMFDDVISLEGKIAEKSYTSADRMSPDYVDKINNVYSREELKELAGAYPLADCLEGLGYGDADRYLVMEPEAIKRIGELYTEDNLETLKNYMLIRYMINVSPNLDSEAYDAYVESGNIMNGSSGREDDKKVAFNRVRRSLTTPMDRLYLEKYDASTMKKQITGICEDVIEIYREMLAEEDWLSKETGEKAIEKLDAITINAVYPDKWLDYSGMDLKDKPLFEALRIITEFNRKEDCSHTNGRVDRDIWTFDILEANAYYNPQDNSINIILGVLDEPVYYDGISKEALLGGIGAAIGHEISHAFDTKGAQYDKDGNYVNWWREEDYKAFKERADKLIKYYDGITVWTGQKAIGRNIQTEAIADMAGIKALLKIAGKTDDFDYDEFFRSYATLWRRLNTREAENTLLTQDPHPLAYLRTNVTLQQFDEFYKTYDIGEDDNMYLAPEDRISVW